MMTIKYDKAKMPYIEVTEAKLEELKQHNLVDYTGTTLTIKVRVVDNSNTIDKAVIDSKMAEIEDWVMNTYRKLFKGKKPKAMGDRFQCLHKMAIFLLFYPEYTLEDIINITSLYIADVVRRNGDFTYLKQADYFIFKEKVVQGRKTLTSELLMWLEDDENAAPSADLFDLIN